MAVRSPVMGIRAGVAARKAAAMPRGKPSGIPFLAQSPM